MLRLVIGPPAAGKSTWVEERATPDDVVIDFDRIAQALTGPGAPSHGQEGAIGDIAYRAREAAISEALRHGRELDIYVIHCVPSAQVISRFEAAGAEIVKVDPGRSVVMERCKAQRDKGAYRAVERWYANTDLHRFPPAVAYVPGKSRGSRRW